MKPQANHCNNFDGAIFSLFFQHRRMWLCKCAISLRFVLSKHRFATNQLDLFSRQGWLIWNGRSSFFGAGCFSSGNFQAKE